MAVAVSQIRKVAAAVADEQWGEDPPPLTSYLPPYAPPPTPALTSKSAFPPFTPRQSFPPPAMSELAFSPRSRGSDVFPPAFLTPQTTGKNYVDAAQNRSESHSQPPKLLLLRPDPDDPEQMGEDRQQCDRTRAMQLERFLDDCLASAVASQTQVVAGVSRPAPLLPGLPPVAFSTSSCNSEPSECSRISLSSPSLSHARSHAPSQSQSQGSPRERQKQGGDSWPVSPRHAHGDSLMDQVDEDWIRTQAAKQHGSAAAADDDVNDDVDDDGNGITEVVGTAREQPEALADSVAQHPKKDVSANPAHERGNHGSRASSISSGTNGLVDWIGGSSVNASSNKSSPGVPANDLPPHPAILASAQFPSSADFHGGKPIHPPAFPLPQIQPTPLNAGAELKPLRPPPGAFRRSVSMADVDKGKSHVSGARVAERLSSLRISSGSADFPALQRFAGVAGDVGDAGDVVKRAKSAENAEDAMWKNLIASAQVHYRELSELKEEASNAKERVRSSNNGCDSIGCMSSSSMKRKPDTVPEELEEEEEVSPRGVTNHVVTRQDAIREEVTPRPSTAATDISTSTANAPWTPTFQRDGSAAPLTPQSSAETAAERVAHTAAAKASCLPPMTPQSPKRRSGLFRKQNSGRGIDSPRRQGSERGLAGLVSAAAGGSGAGGGRTMSRMSSVKKWRVLNALVRQLDTDEPGEQTAGGGGGGGGGRGEGGGEDWGTGGADDQVERRESDQSGWGAPSFSGLSVGGDTEGGGALTEEFSAPWSFGSMGDVERFNSAAGGGYADYSVAAASVCHVSPAIFEAHLHLAETMAMEEQERRQQQEQQQAKTPRTPRGMSFRSNSRRQHRTWDPHHVSVRAAKVKRAIGHVFRKVTAKPLRFLRKLNPVSRAK